MNTKTFIVEILLRARDEISKVMQKVADAIDGVTNAQQDHTKAAEEAVRTQQRELRSLEELLKAHTREKRGSKEFAAELRQQIELRKMNIAAINDEISQLNERQRTERVTAAERKRQHVEEVTGLRADAAARELNLGKVDKEVKLLRRTANERQTAADAEAASSDRSVSTLGVEINERRRHVDSMRREISELDKIATHRENDRRGLRRFFNDIQKGSEAANTDLSKLASTFRGFQIAFVIKYAQALLTVLVSLATTLLNVAQSAVQAGAALVGALVAGAAQAIPVVAVLGAAFARVGAVMQAFKLRNQEQLRTGHDAAAAADRQRSAQESLADAHRRVADAQEALTQARRDARREIEDLINAERRSILSVENAQAALRRAIRSGSAGDVASAEIDVSDARTSLSRTRQDLAPVRAGGPEATDRFKQAAQSLADAKRAEARARIDSARAMDKETAAADRLQAMLALLTPTERRLYDSLIRLQDTYRKNVRPITDILVGAFATAVDRINALLQDNKILAGFRRIAQALGKAITDALKITTGPESRGFFDFITKEAARNIPLVVRIFDRLFGIIRNIAKAASPAFRDLLLMISGFAKQGKDASDNTKGLSDFFRTGIRYLRAWINLGLAVINLFLALSGAGGAKKGTDVIKDFTKTIQGATHWVERHQEKVAAFFEEARKASYAVFRVLLAIAGEIISLFSTRNVQAFSDFINGVLLPALSTTVRVMGFLTSIVHTLLSTPVVREIAAWAAAYLLLGKGLLILRGAFIAIRALAWTIGGAFGPWGVAILAVITAIVLLDRKFHFLGPTFRWLKNAASDAFDWIKKAAMTVVHWAEDVWNKGLLKWLRLPLELWFSFAKELWGAVFKFFGEVIDWFGKKFGEGGPWHAIVDLIALPFKVAWSIIKTVFATIKDGVSIFLDAVAGRFENIGDRIARVWYRIFSTIQGVMVDVINSIVGAVNAVIDAFNALPGPDIGPVNLHLRKMPASYDAAQTLKKAQSGQSTSSIHDTKLEAGGEVKARPGGRLLLGGEGGYDEVMLTTDPRHAGRQKGLLLEYLKKMSPHFAEGGWIQGARATPPGYSITRLAEALMSIGFNITNAWNARRGTSLHPAGMAIDFGDSANNLQRLWSILFPARRGFTELFGPSGLYKGAQRFYNTGLQRSHMDHIHVSIAELATKIGAAVGNLARGGLAGLFHLPRALTSNIRSLLGRDPAGRVGGFASPALGAVWRMAREAIGNIQDRALGGDPGPAATGQGFRGPWVQVMRRIARERKWNLVDWRELVQGESRGIVSNVNRASGAFGLGQFLGETARAYAKFGALSRSGGDQIRAMAQYIWDRYINPTNALRMWKSRQPHWYEAGGAVPGKGPFEIVAHGGEHVWTEREVQRAGGHGAMRALRRMVGGGKQGGPFAYQDGGGVPIYVGSRSQPTRSRARSPVSDIDRISVEITKTLEDLLQQLPRTKKLAVVLRKAFTTLLEEGGIFDQLSSAVMEIANKGALALQRSQFSVGAGGPIRNFLNPRQIASAELFTLQETGAGLQSERASINQGLRTARDARDQALATMHRAKRGSDEYKRARTAWREARSNINDLNARAAQSVIDIAQNAQDQVEANERIQQAAIDAVNETAATATSAQSRRIRLAELGGKTDFAIKGSALVEQGGILSRQRDSLLGLLATASASGNIDAVKDLTDQIADLDVTIAENSQAVRDNTNAAFTARVTDVNERFGFTSGVLGAASTFFQGLATVTGQPATAALLGIAHSQTGALTSQRGGLLSALSDLLGPGFENIVNLSGADLVNTLLTMSQGPIFQSITDRLDPTQQGAFKELINALIANASATNDNTQAISDLAGQGNSQSFTSSFWSTYRYPIFNGAGQLMPIYSPTSARSAAMGSGSAMTMSGSAATRSSDGFGDLHEHWHITTPTEVLDPVTNSRETAWLRRQNGRSG